MGHVLSWILTEIRFGNVKQNMLQHTRIVHWKKKKSKDSCKDSPNVIELANFYRTLKIFNWTKHRLLLQYVNTTTIQRHYLRVKKHWRSIMAADAVSHGVSPPSIHFNSILPWRSLIFPRFRYRRRRMPLPLLPTSKWKTNKSQWVYTVEAAHRMADPSGTSSCSPRRTFWTKTWGKARGSPKLWNLTARSIVNFTGVPRSIRKDVMATMLSETLQ